jgi:SAM-dependent MidA family methyltransferase
VTKTEQLIRQEIERTGPLPFSKFVEIALYHPLYGYYNRAAPQRGLGGDYFTSMQVSNLFPAVFARVFASMKETLGSEQFSLIEVGCGDGEFLESVLKEMTAQKQTRGLRVWAVERSRSARDRLMKRLSRFDKCEVVESLDQIEWMGTLEGCIFSNEFFDAVPFNTYVAQAGQWMEALVDVKDGALGETLHEAAPHIQKILPSIAEFGLQSGHRLEHRPQINSLYEEWGALLARGYVFSVDYGHPRATFLEPPRANGTAIAYQKHEARTNILENAGEQDLTAHVDFTQLAHAGMLHGWTPELFCSQGVLLSTLGEPVIAHFLSDAPDDEKHRRAAAVRQLIHPGAMGEKFWALLQSKDAPVPSPLANISNRIRRLL